MGMELASSVKAPHQPPAPSETEKHYLNRVRMIWIKQIGNFACLRFENDPARIFGDIRAAKPTDGYKEELRGLMSRLGCNPGDLDRVVINQAYVYPAVASNYRSRLFSATSLVAPGPDDILEQDGPSRSPEAGGCQDLFWPSFLPQDHPIGPWILIDATEVPDLAERSTPHPVCDEFDPCRMTRLAGMSQLLWNRVMPSIDWGFKTFRSEDYT